MKHLQPTQDFVKQPFPLQDIELRKYLLDFAILINRAEKAGWDPNSDRDYEDCLEDLIERRHRRIFHEKFENERKEMLSYLEDMVYELNKMFISPKTIMNLIARKSDEEKEKLHVKLDLGVFDKSEVIRLEYRIKGLDSFWKKYVRSLRPLPEGHKKELSYDFGAFKKVICSQQAKEYLRTAEWGSFTEQTRKNVIEVAGNYVMSVLQEHKKKKKKKRRAKRSQRDIRIDKQLNLYVNEIINKKGLTHAMRATHAYEFLIEKQVLLDSLEYRDTLRRIRLMKNYPNLTQGKKDYFDARFESRDISNIQASNEHVLRKEVMKRINDRSLVTMPYGPIVMAMPIPWIQDLEKEVTICSQLALSRNSQRKREIIDIDYLLFNTGKGKDEFLNLLSRSLYNPEMGDNMVYGKRKHESSLFEDIETKDMSCAFFSIGNLVVYASSDEPLEKVRQFMEGIGDESGAYAAITDKHTEKAEEISRLDKTVLGRIEQRKKDKKKMMLDWENDIYKVQQDILTDIKLRNNDIHPGYVLFPDTWRADIIAKMGWLNAVMDEKKNLIFLTEDYFKSPKKNYMSIQDRIMYEHHPQAGNRELTVEEINHTPRTDFHADRGIAEHEKFKKRMLKEWIDAGNSKIYEYGNIFFGDDDKAFECFLVCFHMGRVRTYSSKIVDAFAGLEAHDEDSKTGPGRSQPDREAVRDYFTRALRSYEFLIKNDIVPEEAPGDLIRNIPFEFSRLNPLETCQDMVSNTRKTSIWDLDDFLREELELIPESTRKILDFKEPREIKTRMLERYYQSIVNTAESLRETIMSKFAYPAKVGYQVYAHFALSSMHRLFIKGEESDEACGNIMKDSLNRLKAIQSTVDEFVKANWKPLSEKLESKYRISHMPRSIKPFKVFSYVKEDRLVENIGTDDNVGNSIITNFYSDFISKK